MQDSGDKLMQRGRRRRTCPFPLFLVERDWTENHNHMNLGIIFVGADFSRETSFKVTPGISLLKAASTGFYPC